MGAGASVVADGANNEQEQYFESLLHKGVSFNEALASLRRRYENDDATFAHDDEKERADDLFAEDDGVLDIDHGASVPLLALRQVQQMNS
jgi:hypothetical protein